MRVLVKGAGVAGLCAAYQLSARKLAVEVAEAAGDVGSGASGLAGGMLAPFCEAESAPQEVLTLGRPAAEWWEDVLPPGHVQRGGTLVLAPARDMGELTRFASRTTGHESLDEGQIAALEPALAGRFRKGLFFREEAHLDPQATLAALHRRLVDQGVGFHFGCSGQPAGGTYDLVVDCTGSGAIANLPGLRGVRGEMLYLQTSELSLSRPVRLLHPRHPIYIVPRGGGRFMVGATMIENNDAGPISARSLMELLNTAYALHPAFGEARVLSTGTGIRPAFADNLPRAEQRGAVIHVNGLYRHGFLLAPAMGLQAADLAARVAHQPPRRAQQ